MNKGQYRQTQMSQRTAAMLAACATVAPLSWQWPLKIILQLQQPFRTRPFKDVQPIISCTQLRTVSYFVPAPFALASADQQLCWVEVRIASVSVSMNIRRAVLTWLWNCLI